MGRIAKKLKKKGIIKRSVFIFVIAYTAALLLFYFAYLLDGEGIKIEIYDYVRSFYTEAIRFIMPMLAGAVLIASHEKHGRAYALKHGIFLSLPTAIFSLPYYYLYYFYMTFDSLDALLYDLINTVFDCAVFYGQAVAALFLIRWLTLVFARRSGRSDFSELVLENAKLDLYTPVTLAVFTVSAIKFVILLLLELVNTINYLIEYSGTYRDDEITYIVFYYVFLIIEMLAAHLLTLSLKDKLLKNNATEDIENES